jgi:hypothetical protein
MRALYAKEHPMKFLPLILGAVMLVTACGPQFIEGTEIEDTPNNRNIMLLVEAYRVSVEKKDAATLARLVSRDYFENAATTGQEADDYGYAELLTKVLPLLQDNIKEVQYKVTVQRIVVVGSTASAFLDYDLKFRYMEGELEGWSSKKDISRMDLVWEDDQWKIAAGL